MSPQIEDTTGRLLFKRLFQLLLTGIVLLMFKIINTSANCARIINAFDFYFVVLERRRIDFQCNYLYTSLKIIIYTIYMTFEFDRSLISYEKC